MTLMNEATIKHGVQRFGTHFRTEIGNLPGSPLAVADAVVYVNDRHQGNHHQNCH